MILSRIAATVLIFLTCLFGCGYQFSGSGSVLPPDIKTVYIPAVQNKTSEAILTNYLTEALREEFDRYGAVSVVESAKEADALLEAQVVKLESTNQSVSSGTDVALQKAALMTVGAQLRRKNGVALWRDSKIETSQAFGVTGDVVVTSSADFASSALSGADLGQLSDLEVSRGQEQQTYLNLAQATAKRIYEYAVLPDF